MKKCLISGVAAFVLGGFLASCSHDDEWTSVVDSKLKAYEEYDKYRVIQDRLYMSDFDKEVKRLQDEMGLSDSQSK